MKRKVFIILASMLIALLSANFAYADIGDEIASGIDQIVAVLKKIVNPIAYVAAIVCGIKYFYPDDPSVKRQAKNWGISILVGLALINFSPRIIEWASSIGV